MMKSDIDNEKYICDCGEEIKWSKRVEDESDY